MTPARSSRPTTTSRERLRSLRDHGRVPGSHHEHGHVGTNSRLDTVQAVVLQAKLPLLERWNAERRHLVAVYRALLDPERTPLVREAPDSRGAHHLAVVRVHGRDQVRSELVDAGVGHRHPLPDAVPPDAAVRAMGGPEPARR